MIDNTDKVLSSGSDRNSPVRYAKLQKGEAGRPQPCGDVVPSRDYGKGCHSVIDALGTPSVSRPASVSTTTANARAVAFEEATEARVLLWLLAIPF